jgi:hypothetical protein
MDMIRNNRIKIDQYIQYGFWELYQVFLILGLFVCFLYTFVFDEVGGICHKWDICYDNELEMNINR